MRSVQDYITVIRQGLYSKITNLRSFQRKGLYNSGLKAKSTTFAYHNK